MSSTVGASSGKGVDKSKGPRKSKRPKKETVEDKWRAAKEDYKYAAQQRSLAAVNHPPDDQWVIPPILVLFNAKGGTLKTSHTWNIAYTMSSELRGLKVLAVDLDSQRDLTRSLLKANLLEQAAATGGPPIGIDEHLARPITAAEVEAYNIAQGPDHAVVGVANLTRTLIGGLEPMMGDNPLVKHVVPEQVADNLFLLPGSPVMEDIDRRMTISEGLLHSVPQRNWQGAPLHVIMQAARVVKADIVLLDLNPSLSTINRNMIMSSDYIVVTTRPENFSLENMDTFMNKMVENDPHADIFGGSWLQQMIHNIRPTVNQDIPGHPGVVPARYPLPTTVPKVLGCVIADYSSQGNVENTPNPNREDLLSTQVNGVFHDHAAGAMLGGMNSIIARMGQMMNDAYDTQVMAPQRPFPPPPENVRMVIGRPVYQAAGLTCLLGKIRNYERLGPLTHHNGIPAPFIRPEHCVDVETEQPLPPGGVQGLLTRAADFKRRYDQLAWNILKLMNSDEGGKLYHRLDWALLDRRESLGGPTRADDGCPHAPNVQPGY